MEGHWNFKGEARGILKGQNFLVKNEPKLDIFRGGRGLYEKTSVRREYGWTAEIHKMLSLDVHTSQVL